jgi:hypothetical protein
MKLLSEVVDQNIECLVENTAQGKKYYIEGRWATANEPNRNGRIYPGDVMTLALEKYDGEYIVPKRAMGELNHPSGPSINLDRVSHVIETLKMEGNYVNGRAKIMDTPMGVIAKNLIDEGIKLGVSTRGLGSLEESKDGYKRVKNDFFISAIDIVSDPSGPGCWVNGIMENVDFQMLDDGRIMQLAVDVAKKRVNEAKAIKEFSRLIEIFKQS